MNQINFLPQSFIRQRLRKRRVYREAVLVAVVALAMIGWFASRRHQLSGLETYANAVHAESLAARKQVMEMAKLRDHHKRLTHQVRIQRELAASLDYTQVLATVAELMPQSMTLSALSMNSPQPSPRVLTGDSKSAGKSSSSNASNYLIVQLVGFAPSDVDIANFVGLLADHPLFVNVKMMFSRSAQINTLLAREFRIEMQLPPNRDSRPATTQQASAQDSHPGEITHAD